MKLLTLLLLAISVSLCDGKAIKREKVAILGGGAASCATALALTDQPGWKEHYDITIYELGWRLGGKARSGRNKNYGQRSEGITGHHFSESWIMIKTLMQSVYKELNRPEGAPLRTFEEAFKSHPFFTDTDPNCKVDTKCFSTSFLFQKLAGYFLWMTEKMIKELDLHYIINKEHFNPNSIFLKSQAESIQALVKSMFLRTERNSMKQEFLSIIDTTATVIIGFVEDNLLERGLFSINHLDLRQWLQKHGASKITLDSGFVLAHYDEVISYINGDMHKPDMEAGTALQLYLPLYFCCEGAMYWDHQAGLGDAIFAPIYEVLKRRGVNFNFFYKVEKLILNKNSKIVEEIRMTKQVTLIPKEYNPLINVKGLPSWPNEPKYEEIIQEETELLQKHDIDLESFWSNWSRVYEESFGHPLPEVILKREKDFDIIVYGIPVGSLPFLCAELLDKSPSLRATNEHVGRIPSFQLQLWGTFDLEDYKKTHLIHRLLDTNQRKEVDIVFDYDDILKSEDWKNLDPKHLLYMVSIRDSSYYKIPPSYNTSFPKEIKEQMKGFVVENMQDTLRSISPNSFQDGVFNWTILTDPENRSGKERFDSQYLRLNFNPSDLFTQVLTNTSQYRITTDGAGFDNIYFTGDWIQNGLNYGSIEGAFTSGLLTSKAISGYPETIFFEQFIP